MSLISVLNQIAGKLSFSTEEEKTLFHEQIHALGDEAVTDVKSLVHGVETDAVTDAEAAFAEVPTPPVTTATQPVQTNDPLAGFDVEALEAEIAKRQQTSA